MHRPQPKPRDFVNMIQIEDYQEGSVHTVQEGDPSSSSGTASNASVHTELQHHEDEGVKYDLDIPDHAPGFSQFPSFPPRRGDLIHVVSNDEPPAVGETEQERTAREARNIDRFNRRQIEAEADQEAQRIRVQPCDLNDAFDRVGDKQVFRTPSANVAVAMATMQRLPNTPETQAVHDEIQAYLTAAMAQTAEIINQARAPSISVESSHSR